MIPNIIPSIFTAINQLSGPVKRMGIDIMWLGGISAATSARMERSFARVSTAAMGIATSSAGIAAGILIPLGLATHAAINFEAEMGNVATLVDTAKESITDMGGEVLKMSKIIPKSIKDLSLALYQIRSDGIKAGNGIDQAFGVLESSGKLAVAGLATTTEAAKTVTSAMNVFAEAGLNSQQIANSMFKTVQGGKTTMSELGASFGKNAAIIHSAGVSLYEMNAATAAITATGITASQAQNELGAAVLALMKPTGNLQTIFENLGYAGEGGFKKLIVSAGGLVPAMEKINATAQKLGITMSEDFGRKEALVANILLTGERRLSYYEQLQKQMDGTDTLNGKFAEQSKTAAAQMQLFNNSVNRLGISIGNLLIPALNNLMGALNPVIEGITSFAKEHKTLSGFVIKSIGYFGLFATSVAAIGMVVGTVTRGFVLLKGAIYAYNFIAGVAAVKTGLLNGAILETTAGAKGAALAIRTMGESWKTTAGFIIGAYVAYKGLTELMATNKKVEAQNPLGFDYNKSYESNKEKAERSGISKEQYEKQQKYYLYNFNKINSGGGPIGNSIYSILNGRFGGGKKNDTPGMPAFDSTRIKAQQKINEQMDSDSSYNKAVSYNSAPFIQNNSKHDINITIDNKTGLAASVSTSANNSNKANRVNIVVNSTTSRNKPATA